MRVETEVGRAKARLLGQEMLMGESRENERGKEIKGMRKRRKDIEGQKLLQERLNGQQSTNRKRGKTKNTIKRISGSKYQRVEAICKLMSCCAARTAPGQPCCATSCADCREAVTWCSLVTCCLCRGAQLWSASEQVRSRAGTSQLGKLCYGGYPKMQHPLRTGGSDEASNVTK